MSRGSKAGRREFAVRRQHQQLPQHEPINYLLLQRWTSRLVSVLIAVVTFAAFLPTLQNQFVAWDDGKNLLNNYHYRGLGWTQLRWMWTTHRGHYIPLTWMTFGLDYLLWGMNPVGYHLTNLLLHVANAVVFFFVVRRLLTRALSSPSERGYALAVSAGVAALVFAIHPLRVESVAWATERRDVLSGLLYLLTILVYLRASERGERGRGWYWGAVAVFVLALLSKSMVVNLPVVLLILDVYPLRRLGGALGWWREPARRVYVEQIQRRSLAGSTERAGQAGGVSVRLELLPLEDGRAREPLAALRTAAHGESMGAAVPPELRPGSRHHGTRPGPPPARAGPAGGVGGLHRGPLAGARDLSERPADCR